MRARAPVVVFEGDCYLASVTARRASQDRFVYELDVELDGGRVHVSGRARDINETAVCLTAHEAIEPGQKVQVHLRLVLEWGASETLVVPGLVAWLTPSEGMQQIGVIFNTLLPELRQRLVTLMKVLHGQIALSAPTN